MSCILALVGVLLPAVALATKVTEESDSLASLEVTPGTVTLPIHGTQQFRVVGRDSAGNTVPVFVAWSVESGGGAIRSSGLFTAGTVAGTFVDTVRATSGSVSASASVTVIPGPLHTVAVSPASATLTVRGTQQFSATAMDAWGNTVSGAVSWSVSPAVMGRVDDTGLFTADGAAGSYPAAVSATVEGVTGSADVTLTPECGAGQQYVEGQCVSAPAPMPEPGGGCGCSGTGAGSSMFALLLLGLLGPALRPTWCSAGTVRLRFPPRFQ